MTNIREEVSNFVARHAYNLDRQANSDANGTTTPGDDMVRPEFGYESDINVVVRRGLPAASQARYGTQDLTVTPSDAYLASHEATQAFLRLPPAIRARFNSWAEILQADPKLLDELVQPPQASPEAPAASAAQTSTPASGTSPQ